VTGTTVSVDAALAAVFREEAGRLTGALTRALGNFDVAEESVQDALLTALERWPREGIPRRPGAWLATVARNRAVDRLRRDARYRDKLAQLESWQPSPQADDRLRLMFTCCHPALSRQAQLALTLRGSAASPPPRSPMPWWPRRPRSPNGWRGRGARSSPPPSRAASPATTSWTSGWPRCWGCCPCCSARAIWPAAAASRRAATWPRMPPGWRRTWPRCTRGSRRRWDRAVIAEAVATLERAARLGRPGPYQLQAAIVACHTEAATWAATDWPQILALYDLLLALTPSPVVALNRAVAVRQVAGPGAALDEIEALAPTLDGYHLFHAIRGELLVELGRREQARAAELRALALTGNRAERSLLEQRLILLEDSGGRPPGSPCRPERGVGAPLDLRDARTGPS